MWPRLCSESMAPLCELAGAGAGAGLPFAQAPEPHTLLSNPASAGLALYITVLGAAGFATGCAAASTPA